MPVNVTSPRLVARLTDPSLASALSRFVRARVPESDVEDIVQATLSDALQAEQHPEQDEDIVRWVWGICRHKVIDWFRRMRREVPRDLEGDDAAPAESAPTSAMDLMRWARKELPEGEENEQTLEWMLREGEGEKLESIAAEANLPAPRVRQRVSRLRRYFKARWAAQTAAVAALLLVSIAIFLALRGKKEEIAPRPEPSFEPSSMPLPPPTAPEGPAPLIPAGSTDTPDSAVPSASAPVLRPAPSSTPAPLTTSISTDMPSPKPVLTPPGKGKAAPRKSGPIQSSIDFPSAPLSNSAQVQAVKPVPPPQPQSSNSSLGPGSEAK
jgi:DNA-directed RNA polymerase specialized sigma24 family protein